jgi:uncharacterized protein YdhG (YjbR/CyaY superfamily)
MVLVVSSDESIDVIKHLEAQGEKAWLIGEIVKNDNLYASLNQKHLSLSPKSLSLKHFLHNLKNQRFLSIIKVLHFAYPALSILF